MKITEDDAIIEKVLEGDVNAYSLIVKKYQKPIYNLMLRTVGSEDRAADLAQETFIRAYEKLDFFRPGNKFFSWLYAIGMNLARDSIRKNNKIFFRMDDEKNPVLNRDIVQENTDPYETQIEITHLQFALNKLPLKEKEAIILKYHEGLTMKDIAAALEISVSGVKMRIHRGLKKLRKYFSEEKK